MKKKVYGPTGQLAYGIVGLTIGLLALTSPAFAQTDLPPAPSLLEQAGATVTLRMGVWSSTRELDSDGPFGAGMLWGKIARPITPKVSFLADGWTALRGPFEDGHVRGELREGFVTFISGPVEIRAGRQIIALGRADGINPTDNLTAQDFTVLVPDDSDRRLGSTAVRATYSFRDLSATAIWIPEFRGHRIPLPQVAGDVSTPDSKWRADQIAIRLEQTGRAIDWSVSAFHGGDLSPDLGMRVVGDAPSLELRHHDVTVIGGDAAGNLGRYGLRAEAAYVRTEDAHGTDPFIKNPYLFAVAGGDRTIREHMNVNVQYLFRYVTHINSVVPQNPVFDLVTRQQAVMSAQTQTAQHGASARMSYKWLHDTLEAEVAAAGFARPGGSVVRPKITYAISDRMKLLFGGELYRGAAASQFGMLRGNSGAFAETRWSF